MDVSSAYRQLLIDAIVGRGFPSMAVASRFEDDGLAKFSGNQWSEAWSWDRARLSSLSADQLESIYIELGGCFG